MSTLAPPAAGARPQRHPAPPGLPRRPPPHDRSGFPAHEAIGPTAVLAVVTFGALVGFSRMFQGSGWAGPVLAGALTGHALGWGGRRARLSTTTAVVIGLVGVGLVGVWSVLGSTTTGGVPLGTTWSAVHAALVNAWRVTPTINPPVPELAGFRLLAAWGTGLVAVLADWSAFRRRTVAQALAPATALVIVTAVLSRPSGRVTALLAFLVPAAAFLLVQRNTVGRTGTVWAGARPRTAIPWGAGLAIGGAAALAALAAVPVMAPTDGNGALGWRQGSDGDPGGTRTVISPIVDLRTRLVTEPGVPVMTVASPLPSYWRLTSLDTFTGQQWQSTNSYYPAGRRLPGVAPAPPGTRQVVEQFHIEGLQSMWLPAAFDPEAVSGGGRVTWDPVSGSLLTGRATANGLNYRVTSLQYLATLDPAALEAAPTPVTTGALAQDVALPPLDPAVRSLAERITAGKRTEYEKALALQSFFHSSRFHYSLDPPFDGYGTDALTTFLFETRTGYCQQFAGAYAVLARSIGLPTRLAVGFTSGTPMGPAQYQVTDADAHTWPEVYFPRFGWLPFEPTKGGFQVPGSRGYTGDTTGSPESVTTPAPTATTPPVVSTPEPSHGRSGAASGAAAGQAARAHAAGSGGASPAGSAWPWWWVPIGLAAAAVGALATVAGVRQRRRMARQGWAPGARVVACWDDTEALLAWSGVRRRQDETATELARRAGAVLSPWAAGAASGDSGDALRSLARLAHLVSAASYGDAAVSPAVAAEAEAGRDRLRRLLLDASPWHRRLRWWYDPRLGLLR